MAEALSTKLLYIAGAGRSGTTLLECILGQLPGVFAAGEITHIWDRAYAQNQLCGCGEPFRECPFWSEVTREAFGGPDRLDYSELMELRSVICSLTRVPQLFYQHLRTKPFRSKLNVYREYLTKLYGAIRTVSGCEVIIDSSKYPAELFLLRSIDAIDLSVVHLVRDSKAIAYAWQKHKLRPEVHWTTQHFARYHFLKTAVAWNVYNLVIGSVERLKVPYVMVRYEDLVERPVAAILPVVDLLGRCRRDLDFIGEHSVILRGNHTASGNPSRFKTGEVALLLDSEWQEKSSSLQKMLVDLITFPVRKKYGYR